MAYSEQQQAIIDELSARVEDVLVPVRLGSAVPRDAIPRLLRAVEQFGREWAGRPDIPKAVAIRLVDARASLYGSAAKYPEDIRRELRAAAGALSDAIRRAINEESEKPTSE